MVGVNYEQQTVEIYNPDSERDTQLLVDLFNRNRVYQISNNYEMTVSDWLLTYKAKEMISFYIVREGGAIIGCSGFFRYSIRGVAPVHHVYSGFLLIDGSKRSGAAIASLYEMIGKKSVEMDRSVMITEILPSNRASLHLSRMNGYIKTSETWDDLFHYQASFSYIMTALKSFMKIGEVDGWTGYKKVKILSQKIIEDVITTNFKLDSDELTIKTKTECSRPYYLNVNKEIKIALINIGNRSYLKYDMYQSKCKKIIVFTECGFNLKLYPEKAGIFKLPFSHIGEYKLKINLGKNTLCAILQNKPQKDEQFQLDVDTNNCVLLKTKYKNLGIKFNSKNGDLIYVNNDGYQLFVDTFGAAFFGEKVKFSFKEFKNQIIIKLRSNKIKIDKIVSFQSQVSVMIRVIKGNQVLCKNGIRINHQDYLYYDYSLRKYCRYIPGVTPEESDDIVYQRNFKNELQEYYIYHGQLRLIVESNVATSNQFELRPLILFRLNDGAELRYNYAIKSMESLEHTKNIFGKEKKLIGKQSFIISCICSYGTQFETPVYRLETHNKRNYINDRNLKEGEEVVLDSPVVTTRCWAVEGILKKLIDPQVKLEEGSIINLKNYSGKLEFFNKVSIFDKYFNTFLTISVVDSWITIYFLNNRFYWRVVGNANHNIRFSTNYEVIK
ncbi:hypothetical protein C1940_16890 (plasmid) [Lactiplantibacillus plantarum subsp. plantarum]|uniref:hypothetical protein n=1 Tax=Lactiplantibacillus plantarum TaxID=1590 RepID=UPI000CD331A9|nr:hypothetical protein [Lactiplantibacillus plantarum]AUV74132.1 hypothetical protein C1940_16890 [Lactiplantibacillus plantarum subsp. plantarum]